MSCIKSLRQDTHKSLNDKQLLEIYINKNNEKPTPLESDERQRAWLKAFGN